MSNRSLLRFEDIGHANSRDSILFPSNKLDPFCLQISINVRLYFTKSRSNVWPRSLIPRLFLEPTPFLRITVALHHIREELVRERAEFFDSNECNLVWDF